MRTLLPLIVACLGVSALAFLPYGWGPNLGLSFGYYGEFNQMKQTFEGKKGLRVKEYGQHKDAYLEGFWISGITEEGREFTLEVTDSAKIRTPQEKAKGIVVFTGGYMNGVTLSFDSSFWENYGKESPKHTEALLSDIDSFLTSFEAFQTKPSKLQFEDTLEFVRIRYLRESETTLANSAVVQQR
ncbi:hypothetical protein [Pelagicoccus sp. SDUM812002]|uniref:hypothetical protein n=1 Tax=Pelagicoccus sp. SDUM812002 TaxID=3041266 RepID=UPI0028107C52|nr:hypothetical protein [Pelagicoccus sp. SDUM812002]MDQ8187907.1 hypothetical protein [Pelagicoccus sp. SDUM812002]